MLALGVGVAGLLPAAGLYVPNGSFETPATAFADPRMDAWQKTPKPLWFVEDPEDPTKQWFNVSGQFLNLPPGSPDHIDNCDGLQAAFLFALPEAGIYQELRQPAQGHAPAYAARYRAGRAYRLSLAALGGGGAMLEGVALRAALYYVDASSNRVPVATVTITNTPQTFSNFTHLLTFEAETAKVTPQDPWADQVIGVEILSLADFVNMGGYWDVDQVRVEETVPVPNASFENPATPFVEVYIAGWEKTPKPVWFDEGQGFFWAQLTGLYANTPPEAEDHCPNMHRAQAIWLFAVPEVGLFTDRFARDLQGQSPAPEFDAVYEVGQGYELTAAVFGGGGAMTNGASMALSLYYVDAATNRVTIATTSIVYTNAVFQRLFQDYQVRLPAVKASDPWAGRPIGIRLQSTTGFDRQGGFFNVDNVRLLAIQEPEFRAPEIRNGQFQLWLSSEPGEQLEIFSTDDLATPPEQWLSEGVLTNTTGGVIFSTAADAPLKFIQARKRP